MLPQGGVPVLCVIAQELDPELYIMIAGMLQIGGIPEARFEVLTSDGSRKKSLDLVKRADSN